MSIFKAGSFVLWPQGEKLSPQSIISLIPRQPVTFALFPLGIFFARQFKGVLSNLFQNWKFHAHIISDGGEMGFSSEGGSHFTIYLYIQWRKVFIIPVKVWWKSDKLCLKRADVSKKAQWMSQLFIISDYFLIMYFFSFLKNANHCSAEVA